MNDTRHPQLVAFGGFLFFSCLIESVADVLEGDPQRTSGPGPHGHPPIRDGHYYDGSTSFPPTDRTQEYNIPRSWDTAERPAGYTNLPPQAAGAIRPQLGSPGSDGGYRGNGPGEGNVAASGEYGSGGRRYSSQGGGAKQGDARNEYYGHQQSFPPREPGYTYGTGNSGGRAPFDGGTHDHGPQGGTEGGEGMSSDGYRQQQSLQQRRQPLQQQHQQRAAEVQGRTGQWQSDGISDGGYWAPR